MLSRIVVFVCLVAAAAAANRTLSITVDNEMTLYFDGVAAAINSDPSAKDWPTTKTVPVPAGTRVIAVGGNNVGSVGGVLASLSDGRVSGSSWKVSPTEVTGWMTPGFDDSKWVAATDFGAIDAQPWLGVKGSVMTGINATARWIWTSDANAAKAFFRFRLGPDPTLSITVDNEMTLYFDGVAAAINTDPSAKVWTTTKTVPLPAGTRVIAVGGNNVGSVGGVLASLSDGTLLTSTAWLVSTTEVTGWMQPSFDDSKWVAATDFGAIDAQPWLGVKGSVMSGISADARWIWQSDKNAAKAFFRVHL